jgi:hypothetical protein
MSLKRVYKRLIPAKVRNYIAGHPRVESWRNRQLVRAGRGLAAAARAARKPDGKIRVAFIVQRPAWWPNQASVYSALRADPDFDVSVIAIPKIPAASRELDLAEYHHLQSFFRGKGIAFESGYDVQTRAWIDPLNFGLPDIVVLPQPYNHTQSFLYHAPYLKHFCDLAIIPYSMTTANLPVAQYFLPVYSDCRYIFMESEPHKALFIENRPELAERLFVVGHPKLDLYRGAASADFSLWKCPSAQKRIIWAPHFTVTDDRTPHTQSTFFKYYEFFLEFTKRHPELEVVLRPHPELFEHMIWTGMKSRAESNAYRDRFNALPNGQVYEGGEIFAMFRQSDALILDSCGFLLEYLPTGKPVCYLESMRRQRMNPIGERLIHAYYTAWNAEEIEEFMQGVVLAGADYRREERGRIAARYLYLLPGGAAAEITEIFRQQQRRQGWRGFPAGRAMPQNAMPAVSATQRDGLTKQEMETRR